MPGCGLRPLAQLLDRYARAATRSQRRAIERELFEERGVTRAIMVTDMSGFSRTVARYGIVHYLALIRGCQRLILPTFRRHGGRVLRCEADNTYSIYEKAAEAVAAAREAQGRVAAHNDRAKPEDRIGVSMGVGFGPLLLLGRSDAFGFEFNLASKLGEDIATPGEVLVTQAVRRKARLKARECSQVTQEISGLSLTFYRLAQ